MHRALSLPFAACREKKHTQGISMTSATCSHKSLSTPLLTVLCCSQRVWFGLQRQWPFRLQSLDYIYLLCWKHSHVESLVLSGSASQSPQVASDVFGSRFCSEGSLYLDDLGFMGFAVCLFMLCTCFVAEGLVYSLQRPLLNLASSCLTWLTYLEPTWFEPN